ncbi:glycosyltransferase family 87 protein [Streptomyces meridianus]|uniref:DUF2029 domain-containing protein n=1 Tax=Streptomyces meridianus TaxID=2938945 RepID=A0ABT0X3M0_9ACTN|nr:glycosyltransferase family 87 protein [Streptomyces meridianus]MCM2576409.1 DUF2029 domain-containing protein [Streptomyces meridianus]
MAGTDIRDRAGEGRRPEPRGSASAPPGPRTAIVVWAVTRSLLLLLVFKLVTLPGPDVTSDISVIYQRWYGVLLTGAFPLDDVSWQYPPLAALAVLSPALLPFLDYASAFFLLAFAADAVVLVLLITVGRRPGRRLSGAWVWIAGVALLGPTAYARYDLMVTAVAVAALLTAARHPATAGALTAVGALLKVWPALLLAGFAPGRPTRRAWAAATAAALLATAAFAVTMPGALAFLTFQRDRGTEVESLGSLVFHVARHTGWDGQVLLNYGSVEFLGPYVSVVSRIALVLTCLALGWILLWRLRARTWTSATVADAAFTAVLLFTVTSRVISPQYMAWLIGIAAVCMTTRSTCQRLPALLVVVATGVTLLEFPVWFAHVVASDALGITLIAVRNGLLVAATLLACRGLWRTAVHGQRASAAA